MKPVTVTITIERPREEIYAVLEDLMNHESFTDHFLTDFQRTDTGIRVKGKSGGGWMEITPVESTPERIVEEGRSGRGMRRHTKGIYELKPANGGTVVSFTNEIEPAGIGDRVMAPVMRAYLRKQNGSRARAAQGADGGALSASSADRRRGGMSAGRRVSRSTKTCTNQPVAASSPSSP